MDLSSETFNQLENIPTAAGRGWLASNLKRDDWTVKLSDGAFKEIATMADEMRSKPLPTLLRNPQQFEIPGLSAAYRKAKHICDNGLGFAVIDKFPLDNCRQVIAHLTPTLTTVLCNKDALLGA